MPIWFESFDDMRKTVIVPKSYAFIADGKFIHIFGGEILFFKKRGGVFCFGVLFFDFDYCQLYFRLLRRLAFGGKLVEFDKNILRSDLSAGFYVNDNRF